jgi:hypothetical protein
MKQLGSRIAPRSLRLTRRCATTFEAERQFAEIRLRAAIKIGELSRELEKAPPIRGDLLPTDGKKITKEQTLAEAGISTTTANDYEQLTGGREEQAQQVAAFLRLGSR